MENNVIDPTKETAETQKSIKEELSKQVEKLNEALENEDGMWRVSNEFGVVWCPNQGDKMGKPLGVPSPSTPPLALESLIEWGKQIDFDNLPDNVVIIIKLNADDPYRIRMMQQIIARQVLEPRIDKLKAKKACILFMQPEDDISVMTEEEMNKAGWEKKEKSRIITL